MKNNLDDVLSAIEDEYEDKMQFTSFIRYRYTSLINAYFAFVCLKRQLRTRV